MITVCLYGAEFFAFHGFYTQEQKLGNKFLVDIEVSFEGGEELAADELHHTVNYEQLYEIAAGHMKQTRKLLETVAYEIAQQIKDVYPFVKLASVSIKKLNLAFEGKVDYSRVKVDL